MCEERKMNWIHVNDEMPPPHPIQPNFSIQVLVTDGVLVGAFKEMNIDVTRYCFHTKRWQILHKISVTHWCYLSMGELKDEPVQDLRRSAYIEVPVGRPFEPKGKARIKKITKELGWPQPAPMKTRYKMPFVQREDSYEKKYATCMQDKTNLIGKLAMSEVKVRNLQDMIVKLQLVQPEPNFNEE